LHPLKAEHAESLFPILRNEQLWRYTDDLAPEALSALRERYAKLESRRSADGRERWLNWALETYEDSRIIGFVQATVELSTQKADVAYVLARFAWGRGLASEGVGVMLAFLAECGVREVRATVDQRNVPSIRLLERLDFHLSNAEDPKNLCFSKRGL
jgi:RimJ/RimL family protein N-acetyltransferase